MLRSIPRRGQSDCAKNFIGKSSLLYHIFLDPSGLGMACVISVLALFLLWAYRDRFGPLLKL